MHECVSIARVEELTGCLGRNTIAVEKIKQLPTEVRHVACEGHVRILMSELLLAISLRTRVEIPQHPSATWRNSVNVKCRQSQSISLIRICSNLRLIRSGWVVLSIPKSYTVISGKTDSSWFNHDPLIYIYKFYKKHIVMLWMHPATIILFYSKRIFICT